MPRASRTPDFNVFLPPYQLHGQGALNAWAKEGLALGIAMSTADRGQRGRGRKPETQAEKRAFNSVRKAEVQYGQALKSVAAHVGSMLKSFDPGDPSSMTMFEGLLSRYSEAIKPWAAATAQRMLLDVSRRDEVVWNELGRDMSRALRDEVRKAPTGEMLRKLLNDQVELITSLPRGAAQRVHELVLKGQEEGTRATEIAAEIMRTSSVTKSRAMLIARTEVARASSGLVQARSVYVGSEGYIWRSAEDSDVRPALSLPSKVRANFVGSHRKLNGTFIRWDSPPVSGQRGERAHAGCIYNCRCYPEPVIPDEL